jgi:hypothetical protein
MSFVYLAKQVKDAERFFRASANLQILNERNSARHLDYLSQTAAERIANNILQANASEGTDPENEFQALMASLGYLRQVLSRSEFHGVSQRYTIFQTAEDAVREIDSFIRLWPNGVKTREEFLEARNLAVAVPYNYAEDFTRALNKGCKEWLAKADEILKLE